jgi:CIC family chloride channel protein
MFELTGEYTIILPLMAAIVLATSTSHLLTADTIYTLKLRRRGVDLDDPQTSPVLATVTVAEVMEPVGPTLAENTTLIQAAAALARSGHGHLAVLDRDGHYQGIMTARTVAETIADGTHDQTPISSVIDLPCAVTVDHRLEQTLDILDTAAAAVPVLDSERANLVGWLTPQRVLTALHPARATPPLPSPVGADRGGRVAAAGPVTETI